MTDLNLKHILVPVDFSEPSLSALDTGIAMAKRHGATLTVFHVLHELIPYYGSIDILPINAATVNILQEDSDIRLKEITEDLAQKHHINIQTKTAQGFVVSEICSAAEELAVDIIVMGTHGSSGFREFFVGTNAYEVVKHAPCPVLTVPPGQWESFSKILFPIRNTAGALEKFDLLRKIIRQNKAVLFILGLPEGDVQVSSTWIEEKVLRLEKMLVDDEILCVTKTLPPNERTAQEVLQTAEQEKMDLIAITATIDHDIRDFFVGPYAQQIVNHAKVPVLSIRPTQKIVTKFSTEVKNAKEHFFDSPFILSEFTPISFHFK